MEICTISFYAERVGTFLCSGRCHECLPAFLGSPAFLFLFLPQQFLPCPPLVLLLFHPPFSSFHFFTSHQFPLTSQSTSVSHPDPFIHLVILLVLFLISPFFLSFRSVSFSSRLRLIQHLWSLVSVETVENQSVTTPYSLVQSFNEIRSKSQLR
jgi:hypothetical protein